MEGSILESVKNSVKHWYLLLLVGLIFLAVGIWTAMTPLSTYLTLAVIFSISFLATGIAEVMFAISNRKELHSWGWTLVLGIANILVGLLLINNPAVSILTLPFYVGFNVLFRSFTAIGTSIDMANRGIPGTGSLLGLGILGLFFAYILLWNPGFAGLSLVIWTALAFLTAGVYSIYFSFKLKNLHSLAKKFS
ncbi:HdeD family acid-resistance protein [Spirosoma litoris]